MRHPKPTTREAREAVHGPPGRAPSDTALRRNGVLVAAGFGLLWALAGGAPDAPAVAGVAVAVTAALVVKALRPGRPARVRALPRNWWTRFCVVGAVQAGAIAIIVAGAIAAGIPGLIAPAVCLVVGLHFLPLAGAVDQPEYLLTGAALIGVGLLGVAASAILGPVPGQAASGLGAAMVLWATSWVVGSRP